MKKNKLIFLIIALMISIAVPAQLVITDYGGSPHLSAMLHITNENNDKGVLLPRMTLYDIAAISDPADGLLVYNTSDESFYFYDGYAELWKELEIGVATITPYCGTPVTYGGGTYQTVQIGTQCWMAENLNAGSMIPVSENQTGNLFAEKYCYFDMEEYCDLLGGLYQWDEMMTYGGVDDICGPGWHVPSDDEWKQLEGAVDSYYGYPDTEWEQIGYRGSDAGHNLKHDIGWAGGNGSNAFGFSAAAGGWVNYDGDFEGILTDGLFWTSTETSTPGDVWARRLKDVENKSGRITAEIDRAFSVRCLKD